MVSGTFIFILKGGILASVMTLLLPVNFLAYALSAKKLPEVVDNEAVLFK